MSKKINKKRNRKGFTLVELVVVIAILAVLSALAIPRLSGSRDRASRSAVLANLRTIDSAIMIAEADGRTPDTGEIAKIKIPKEDGADGVEGDFVKEYLKGVPKGPSGATYHIVKFGTSPNEDFRAAVVFSGNNTFGFEISNESVDDKHYYILDGEKLEKGKEVTSTEG